MPIEGAVVYVWSGGSRVWHAVKDSTTPLTLPESMGRALCRFIPKYGWSGAANESPGYMPGCSRCHDRIVGNIRRGPITMAGRTRRAKTEGDGK